MKLYPPCTVLSYDAINFVDITQPAECYSCHTYDADISCLSARIAFDITVLVHSWGFNSFLSRAFLHKR